MASRVASDHAKVLAVGSGLYHAKVLAVGSGLLWDRGCCGLCLPAGVSFL